MQEMQKDVEERGETSEYPDFIQIPFTECVKDQIYMLSQDDGYQLSSGEEFELKRNRAILDDCQKNPDSAVHQLS